MTKVASILFLILFFTINGFSAESITFYPIEHATFIIQSSQRTIFVDPVGNKKNFETFPTPDLILVTDTHTDHFSAGLIKDLANDQTVILGPKVVIDLLKIDPIKINSVKQVKILNNGESLAVWEIKVKAIPMYNITPARKLYHPKGRGNGYVLTIEDKRIYISGDTEDIPEMRALKNIDYAFVCMNLPYTMTVDQAASAVLEMRPAIVFPYHYRGKPEFSDLEKFKQLVHVNPSIKVKLLNWYE